METENETSEPATDGRNLILSPQGDRRDEPDLLRSLEKINGKIGKTLSRLGA